MVSCGNCYMLLDRFRHKIQEAHPEISLPIMFLPQVLGQALDVSCRELGLELV